jgi:hypothetical protein
VYALGMFRKLLPISVILLLSACQAVNTETGDRNDVSVASSSSITAFHSSSLAQSSVSWKTYSNPVAGFSFKYPEKAFHPSLTFNEPEAASTSLKVIEDPTLHQVFLTPAKLGFANKDTQSMAYKTATLEVLRSYAADTGIWKIQYTKIPKEDDLTIFLKKNFSFEADLGARWRKVQTPQEGVYDLVMEYDCYQNLNDPQTLSVCPMNTDYVFKYRPDKQQLIWWSWDYKHGDPRFWKTANYQFTDIDYSHAFDKEIVENFHLF